MPNLKFKQLLIMSSSAETANQFEFSEGLNLITASDNSVGKSTLVKLLFWTFGCEPSFDSRWIGLDCKTLVRFQIEENNYEVMRYKDLMSLKIGDEPFVNFSKITGDYSKKIAEILEFRAVLPNRSTGELEVPPPAYYFLPFYIDQVKSWASAWNNFDKLMQYDKWRNTIIKYHVGLLTPEHFELDIKKKEKRDVESQISKLDTAMEVVETYVPKFSNTTFIDSKLLKMTDEIKNDLTKISLEQEKLLDELVNLESEKAYLMHQKAISEQLIIELDKDYKFSVENLSSGELECPLCGVIHDNSIITRASILTDKIQAENQLNTINGSIDIISTKLEKANLNLRKIRNRIAEINEKYIIEDPDQKVDFNQIFDILAGSAIKENVDNTRKNRFLEKNKISKDIKQIQKVLKTILTPEKVDSINSDFISIFSSFNGILNATVNLSLINSPLHYSKIIKEGGAADSARAILAYYLTIFTMVEKYSYEVKCALVVDTPNQHEQSFTNYDKIVDLLTNHLAKDTQVILCAMENAQLEPFRKKANVILLDSRKLLIKEKYQEIKKMFDLI